MVSVTFIVGIIKGNRSRTFAAVQMGTEGSVEIRSVSLPASSSESQHCLPVHEFAYYYVKRSALM